MSVTRDKRDSVLTQDAGGVTLTRSMNVPVTTNQPERFMWDAINDPSVPRIGDGHPTIPDIRVVSHEVRNGGSGHCEVRVNYKIPATEEKPADEAEPSTIELTAGTSTQIVQTDNQGRPLAVAITIQSTDADGVITTDTRTKIAQAEIIAPQLVVRVERKESQDILSRALPLVGSVNESFFMGVEARTMLCIGVRARSPDDGLTYRAVYEFQYKPDTWDKDLVFLDENGEIHPQVNIGTGETIVEIDGFILPDGNGVARYQLYPNANFNFLNLPNVL